MIERAGSVVGGRTLSEKTSETGRKVWPLSGRRRRCCCTGGGCWAGGAAARASASAMVGFVFPLYFCWCSSARAAMKSAAGRLQPLDFCVLLRGR